MAMKLCADPEGDYYRRNTPVTVETEEGVDKLEGGTPIDTQNFAAKINVWWIIIAVVMLLLVIAIVLVLILWRAYKMQKKSNKQERY